jgi:hypothetical protein
MFLLDCPAAEVRLCSQAGDVPVPTASRTPPRSTGTIALAFEYPLQFVMIWPSGKMHARGLQPAGFLTETDT